jgi:hypothetical protein
MQVFFGLRGYFWERWWFGFLFGVPFWFLFGLVMILRVVVGVMTGGQSVMLGELPCLLLLDVLFF